MEPKGDSSKMVLGQPRKSAKEFESYAGAPKEASRKMGPYFEKHPYASHISCVRCVGGCKAWQFFPDLALLPAL